jgi:hypothetical protein
LISDRLELQTDESEAAAKHAKEQAQAAIVAMVEKLVQCLEAEAEAVRPISTCILFYKVTQNFAAPFPFFRVSPLGLEQAEAEQIADEVAILEVVEGLVWRLEENERHSRTHFDQLLQEILLSVAAESVTEAAEAAAVVDAARVKTAVAAEANGVLEEGLMAIVSDLAAREVAYYAAVAAVTEETANQHLAELIEMTVVEIMVEAEQAARFGLESMTATYWNTPYLAKLRTKADIEAEAATKAKIAAEAARVKAAAVMEAARVDDAVAATAEGVLEEGLLAIVAELAAEEMEDFEWEKARKATEAKERRISRASAKAKRVAAAKAADAEALQTALDEAAR